MTEGALRDARLRVLPGTSELSDVPLQSEVRSLGSRPRNDDPGTGLVQPNLNE